MWAANKSACVSGAFRYVFLYHLVTYSIKFCNELCVLFPGHVRNGLCAVAEFKRPNHDGDALNNIENIIALINSGMRDISGCTCDMLCVCVCLCVHYMAAYNNDLIQTAASVHSCT